MFSRPDKGVGTIPHNKSDYVVKMEAVLNDNSKFVKNDEGK